MSESDSTANEEISCKTLFDVLLSNQKSCAIYNELPFSAAGAPLVDTCANSILDPLPGCFVSNEFVWSQMDCVGWNKSDTKSGLGYLVSESSINLSGIERFDMTIFVDKSFAELNLRVFRRMLLTLGVKTLLIETCHGYQDHNFCVHTRIWCETMELAAEIFSAYLLVV